ncbi:flagellin [Neobacillus sp. NPDC093127]|uniref:flagellin N-terminal helical domain-containing protein n=1 Tax=Neobacillus sp. NPDC093127 TaxID=3364296 RepID=UPI00382DF6A8
MRINHNISAQNTYRQLSTNNANQAKNMEKLSSGLRINRGADDAAGLSISEKMRAQVRGLDQASKNAQDGISMIQTADGALNETHNILQRMRELSVQSSTDTLAQQDRDAIGEEMVALRDQINTISQTTQFNGKNILNGDLAASQATGGLQAGNTVGAAKVDSIDVSGAKAGTQFDLKLKDLSTDTVVMTANGVSQEIKLTNSMFDTAGKKTVLDFDKLGIKITLDSTAPNTGSEADDTAADLAGKAITTTAGKESAQFSVGANGTDKETITVAFKDMSADKLGLDTLTKNTMSDVTTSQAMTKTLDTAIAAVSTQRSSLGAAQNRLEFTNNNLASVSQNLTSAESRIRDVDMAREIMESSKNGILAQAAQAMLSQANQAPQSVLQLLRG